MNLTSKRDSITPRLSNWPTLSRVKSNKWTRWSRSISLKMQEYRDTSERVSSLKHSSMRAARPIKTWKQRTRSWRRSMSSRRARSFWHRSVDSTSLSWSVSSKRLWKSMARRWLRRTNFWRTTRVLSRLFKLTLKESSQVFQRHWALHLLRCQMQLIFQHQFREQGHRFQRRHRQMEFQIGEALTSITMQSYSYSSNNLRIRWVIRIWDVQVQTSFFSRWAQTTTLKMNRLCLTLMDKALACRCRRNSRSILAWSVRSLPPTLHWWGSHRPQRIEVNWRSTLINSRTRASDKIWTLSVKSTNAWVQINEFRNQTRST